MHLDLFLDISAPDAIVSITEAAEEHLRNKCAWFCNYLYGIIRWTDKVQGNFALDEGEVYLILGDARDAAPHGVLVDAGSEERESLHFRFGLHDGMGEGGPMV